MTGRVAVIPYGVGIGDMVNMRPLVEAVVHAYPTAEVVLVAPRHLAWLVVAGASSTDRVQGLGAWRRLPPDHPAARVAGRLHVGQLAPIVRAVPSTTLASLMAQDLRRRGFDLVVNLLEAFSMLDLDRRWTAGAWSTDRRHVIDLLAIALERQGIALPPAQRAPRLRIEAVRSGRSPAVILNPVAGSTLKEAPTELWVRVARCLLSRGMTPLLLVFPGRDDAQIVARAVPGCVLLASSSLRQVAAWVAGADALVSPDTGVLHLASALRTPYVGLYGSTDPLFLGPYDRGTGIMLETPLEHPLVCRGCWTAQLLPSARCPVYPPDTCLRGIAAHDIADSVDRLLSRRGRHAVPHPGRAE